LRHSAGHQERKSKPSRDGKSSSGLLQKLRITHTMENMAKDGRETAASPAHRNALLLV